MKPKKLKTNIKKSSLRPAAIFTYFFLILLLSFTLTSSVITKPCCVEYPFSTSGFSRANAAAAEVFDVAIVVLRQSLLLFIPILRTMRCDSEPLQTGYLELLRKRVNTRTARLNTKGQTSKQRIETTQKGSAVEGLTELKRATCLKGAKERTRGREKTPIKSPVLLNSYGNRNRNISQICLNQLMRPSPYYKITFVDVNQITYLKVGAYFTTQLNFSSFLLLV